MDTCTALRAQRRREQFITMSCLTLLLFRTFQLIQNSAEFLLFHFRSI